MSFKKKQDRNLSSAKTKRKNRDTFRERMKKPCTDCGKVFPYYVVEFDHVPERGEKVDGLPRLARRYGLNSLIYKAELAKCDLVCGNCHNVRTHMRQCQDKECECHEKDNILGQKIPVSSLPVLQEVGTILPTRLERLSKLVARWAQSSCRWLCRWTKDSG